MNERNKKGIRLPSQSPTTTVSQVSIMATFLLRSTPSNPLLNFSNIHCSLKPDFSKPNNFKTTITPRKIPARDRVIDFGKHKGKMLGTLPSTYLKWVSKNLRAQDFEEWAQLADQVLIDPVYNDRVEWEFADKLLNGDVLSSSTRSDKSPVQDLLEISQRFGWDNEDKSGWSKVNFQLLGTSKGGRIPRILDGFGGGKERGLKLKREKVGEESDSNGGDRERREERRERMRTKRGVGIIEKKEKLGIRGIERESNKFGDQDDRTMEIHNPFPGREALLKKVLNKKRVM